ncbi:MAG: metallophosphoesterase [Clostridia bacterium]|nr:metallophosphoesterase [Clostridia bacterium]
MKIHRLFVTILCFSLCASALLCSCGGAAGTESGQPSAPDVSEAPGGTVSEESPEVSETSEDPETSAPQPETPFVPVIRFAVASDIHISSASDASYRRFVELFNTAYAYAESDPEYNKLDAVIAVGDLTNKGLAYEYAAFKKAADAGIREGTRLITVMGNHELYEGGAPVYLKEMDDKLDKHIVINGIHFIGISPDSETGYSAQSVKFLKEELKAAAEEGGPDRPIIVFRHHHIKDTVYVSPEWYASNSAQIKNALSAYPQVIDFSGHSHGPVNDPRSIWQGKFTAFGTGTLSYFEMESGMSYGTIPPNANNAGQYYIVEISADWRVKVMPYDILTKSFFKTPSNTDGEDETMVYYIDSKKDPSLFRYKDRAENADIPYFADGASIEIYGINENSAVIRFPQAYDGECIYSYDIDCTSSDGKKLHYACFSEYYFEPLAKSIPFTITALADGEEYEVAVTPVDCFGKKGEPIRASFRTVKADEVVYSSELDVTYSGTFTNFDVLPQKDGKPALSRSAGNLAYGTAPSGDVFAGAWDSGESSASACFALDESHGYQGSPCIAVWSTDAENRGLYLLANGTNKWSTAFPAAGYLRVWVDFTDVGFRKANFGLMADDGSLFTTDEEDYRTDQYFWYMAEGTDKWERYTHGNDGCFGDQQGSDVHGFKGWLAFPVSDFKYRAGTGVRVESVNNAYHSNTVRGVYMFWDYSEGGKYDGNRFYLDEIAIVKDYTVFEPYDK